MEPAGRKRPLAAKYRRRWVAVVAMVALVPIVLLSSRRDPPAAPKTAGGDDVAARVAPDEPVRLLQTTKGFVLPVEGAGGGSGTWNVLTPCGRRAVLHGTPIGSVDVVIDPGHGGSETGAVGHGLQESALNLEVARELRDQLAAYGHSAVLTRDADVRISIETRTAIIRAAHPKLFVSVHHNAGAAARRSTPGDEVYFQHTSTASRRLAGVIWEDLTDTLARLAMRQVGASDAGGAIYRLGRDGADYYGILRQAAPVAGVLVEPTYISEASQARLLADGTLVTAEARAIARGVHRFLTTADPGAGYRTPLDRGYRDGGGGTTKHCQDPELGR